MIALVKPFTEDDIAQLMDELLARIPQPDKYLPLKTSEGELRLGYKNILYAEHFAHVIYIHTTAGKTLTTRQPFKTFIEPLKSDPRFFVCGRGVIVNNDQDANKPIYIYIYILGSFWAKRPFSTFSVKIYGILSGSVIK